MDISQVVSELWRGVREPKHPPAGSRGKPTPAAEIAADPTDPAADLRGAAREKHLAEVRHVESFGTGQTSTERPRNIGPGGGALKRK